MCQNTQIVDQANHPALEIVLSASMNGIFSGLFIVQPDSWLFCRQVSLCVFKPE